MQLPHTLGWLVDEAADAIDPEGFLIDLVECMTSDGLPLAGSALMLSVPHPVVARRTFLWRADGEVVIEALDFHGAPVDMAVHQRLEGLGPVACHVAGQSDDAPVLGWAGRRPFRAEEEVMLAEVARFATAPLAALSARTAMQTLLDAYLGRRSAARVLGGALQRGSGETIPAALLYADLRGFTEMSEAGSPETVIAALDAWFDRVTGAVHAFGGEVLKFIGDGVLAIFPAESGNAEACVAALNAANAARAGMASLETKRQADGARSLHFGMALHLGNVVWGNVGSADRLDFTAIGPAVNLVSRLEGLCKPLGRPVLISGAVAAEIATPLLPLGEHVLRGISAPCAVFTLPEG